MKAIKYLWNLVLIGVFVFAGLNMPSQVTAEHDQFVFDVPHLLAQDILDLELHIAGPPQTYEAAGCDFVVTLPLHGKEGKLVGFAIHAAITDEKGILDATGHIERLVVLEMWSKTTKEKYFSYVNKDDYSELKKCHDAAKGQLGV
jgi:hypothetical protein